MLYSPVLAKHDAQQFTELLWGLETYANNQLGLLPLCTTIEDYKRLGISNKLKIRHALFDKTDLIDKFIHENPYDLAEEELEIVRQWKNFIRGNFFIERCLSRYTIFIKDQNVYAVLGLNDPIQDLLPYDTPILVKTILFPFKGQIVYDGTISTYQIHLGSGIRSQLKELYLQTKQRKKIISNLEGGADAHGKPSIGSHRDWQPEVEELLKGARKLRSGTNAPVLQGPTFNLAKASLELSLLVARDPHWSSEHRKAVAKVARALQKISRILDDDL